MEQCLQQADCSPIGQGLIAVALSKKSSTPSLRALVIISAVVSQMVRSSTFNNFIGFAAITPPLFKVNPYPHLPRLKIKYSENEPGTKSEQECADFLQGIFPIKLLYHIVALSSWQ
jgi:hypothetical protein